MIHMLMLVLESSEVLFGLSSLAIDTEWRLDD